MQQSDPIEMYANWMQMQVAVIDANKVFVEAGRGTGKTEGVTGPRTVRVAASMPFETSVFMHRTYVALFSNIIPGLLSYYRTPRGPQNRPMLREGIDYVVGEKDLPKHFQVPRYPILHPEHSIVFANGHNIRLAASDQADSIAGTNIVHGFFEEMKHNSGDKLRSRVFPAFRTSRLAYGAQTTHLSPYYGGITGVSDTARVSLGEDSWFQDYEKKQNPQLIADIVSMSLHLNRARYAVMAGKDVETNRKILERYEPVLADLRRECTMYIRVSSFVNREVLGPKYFTTQLETLEMSEFLSSVCSIRDRDTENCFFELFDEDKHTFDDSYVYKDIMSLSLKESFRLDSGYLKHYDRTKKILLGYDPGSFRSMVVAQEKQPVSGPKELRILKEFYVYSPDDIADLADAFSRFFCTAGNKHIDLYYDRAGNKKESRLQEYKTDIKTFKAELQKRGWVVNLMNERQATIYHWQHHRLWRRLLANEERKVPRILIDANECPNLISAIHCCKKVQGSSPVELDKRSEKLLPLDRQAGLTPQIPSGMMYLVYGLYGNLMPGDGGQFRDADFVEITG